MTINFPARSFARVADVVQSVQDPLRIADPKEAADLLSGREREIAAYVARGLSNKEIGRLLGISHWTVSAHLRRVFTKLAITRRIELCLLLAHGMI